VFGDGRVLPLELGLLLAAASELQPDDPEIPEM
jgi:hypothetical protein